MKNTENKNRIILRLKRPHVTEKASLKSTSENNAYTFLIEKGANKHDIAFLIKEIYKVQPRKVNIINLPEKKVFSRGKRGVKPGKRKAVVYLKKGDKIDFV